MFENSFRWNAMYRIICEHLIEQIVSGIVEHFDLFTQLLLCPTWECFFVIGKWHYTRPNVIGWSFQDSNAVIERYEWNSNKIQCYFYHVLPEHSEQLINFGITLEQWLSRCHFCKYTANRPYIHVTRVSLWAQQNFRCSIPQSDNFMRVHSNRNAKCTSQSKVSNLIDDKMI